MKERIRDGWNAILLCAHFLSMLVAAAAAATVTSSSSSTTTAPSDAEDVTCPAMPNGCSCYVFDDDVYLECASPTLLELRHTLSAFAHLPVRSLSVYNLDPSVTTVKAGDFGRPLRLRQLHISLSHINQLTEESFRHIREQLESLAIVSAKLRVVPRKTLPYMIALRTISFEANQIVELADYSFYGLRLEQINLKGNAVSRVAENAFAGLEETLESIDLSANRLKRFPTAAVRRLRHLVALKLASNAIAAIPDDGYSLLESVRHVDLAGNRFASVAEDAFRALPNLRTLSLHGNGAQALHRRAFASLAALQSLDLSHNQLVLVEEDTFRGNLRLGTIDLSHNHLHRIDGLFANLVELRELFLGDNNVLAVPRDTFANATALDVLHLHRNAVHRIDEHAFAGNSRLRQLRLSDNAVSKLPVQTLAASANLVTLNLDRNAIVELQPATFVGATALRELRLHDNSIAHIRDGVFEPLHHLVELHLQRNAIATIESGAFGAMRSLQYVNLRDNALRELGNVFHPHATALVSVQLGANRLASIDTALAAQSNAEIVRLGCNRLAQLEYAQFTDLRSVRSLYITDNVIADIEDGAFRAMTALHVLDLSANRLRAVSASTFAGLDALRDLLLASNRLEAIADDTFTALSQLRFLDLSANALSTLQAPLFHPNAPLERLLLRNCRLVAVDQALVTALRLLNELDLRTNRLADGAVQLRSNSLRVLDLSANNLTRLPSGSLDAPALRELRLEDGQLALIESGAFSRTPQLESFSVRRNRLRQLPDDLFRTTRHLRFLRLDDNLLTAVPRAVASLVSIRRLSIAGNRLGEASIDKGSVDVCAMRALRNLTELNVSSNAIAALTGFGRCNFTRLIHLDLSANQLITLPEDIFCGAVSLRSIDLSANRFARLPLAAIARCPPPNLERLVFDKNPIIRISGTNGAVATDVSPQLTHASSVHPQLRLPLRELIVGGCANLTAIGSADLNPFDRLASLRLACNAIAHILPGAFRSHDALLALDLGDNRIASLPPQRLRGLRRLKSFNLTRNALRTLDPFGEDLQALETLDLSHNRLEAIDQRVFRYLTNLTELRLRGNRIATIAGDAFRSLHNLRQLDVAGNQMHSLPLDAFKPLETRLRSLVLEGNPLVCECAQEEAWEWLRDHEKLTSRRWTENEVGTSCAKNDNKAVAVSALQCQEPAELQGRPFLQTEPSAFCISPLLVSVAVHDIRPFSVNVSWQARDYSRLRAYQIVRNIVSIAPSDQNGDEDGEKTDDEENVIQLGQEDNDDNDDDDQGNDELLDGDARWALVTRLYPSTRYSICVIGLGDEQGSIKRNVANSSSANATHEGYLEQRNDRISDQSEEGASNGQPLQQQWTRCVEVRTLDGGRGRRNRDQRGASLLTRRLGLIIGSCMGCVVFAALVVVLVYTKAKKQRRNAKHQQPLPPEYLSYRHFSLRGCERPSAADLASVVLRR